MLHRAFTGGLTARWREAHVTELLQEMEQQARAVRSGIRNPPSTYDATECRISLIVVAELWVGAEKSARPDGNARTLADHEAGLKEEWRP